MTAVINFDIIQYFPEGYNFKGFTFNFRMNTLDETIDKKNTIKINISNLEKDRKFVIRVYKTGSLIGISEMFLANQMFADKLEEYIKTVNVIMTDSVRNELFGIRPNNSKPFQITIKTKIEYDVDACGEDADGDEKKPVAYNLEDGGAERITVVSQAAKGFSKKALMEQNEAARMSVYALKSLEQDFLDRDQSFIDPIFDDENESEFQNEDAPLNAFLDQINEKFSSDAISSETNPEILADKCREAVMAVFEAQKIYYTAFYKTQSLNKFLRELLVKYNQKYRVIFKKYNKLRQEFETLNMKKNLSALNTDENKRIVAAMEHSVNELEIYRKLFNVVPDLEGLQKFKADIPGRDEKKRNLLKKVIKGIYKNNADSVSENQKLSLNYVVGKYTLDNEEDYNNHHEENHLIEQPEEGDEEVREERHEEYVEETREFVEETREVVEETREVVEENTEELVVEETGEEVVVEEEVVEEEIGETVEVDA